MYTLDGPGNHRRLIARQGVTALPTNPRHQTILSGCARPGAVILRHSYMHASINTYFLILGRYIATPPPPTTTIRLRETGVEAGLQ